MTRKTTVRASLALFAGAIFGYQLLWVAPLAMALGMIMLTALAISICVPSRRAH